MKLFAHLSTRGVLLPLPQLPAALLDQVALWHLILSKGDDVDLQAVVLVVTEAPGAVRGVQRAQENPQLIAAGTLPLGHLEVDM